MTRQEPQARRRLCKKAWRSSAKKPVLRDPPLSQPVSSKKASPSSSKAGSASQPASSCRPASQSASSRSGLRREASGGEESTEFFRKTREMTSLRPPPRRKPSVPRPVAHSNGVRDVKKARTSPQVPPESHRLASPIPYILRKGLVFCGKFWYCSAIIKRQKPLLCGKFCVRMSGTFSRPSGASTPPNLRSVIKNRNVFRIG